MASQSENSDSDLKKLLIDWDLEYFYDHFIEQKINLKVMRILQQRHIDKLLENLPVGDQARFEHRLAIWKNSMLLEDFETTKPSAIVPAKRKEPSTTTIKVKTDLLQDNDVLEASESNDTAESDIVEINEPTPQPFHTAALTPTPRVVVPAPRIGPETVTPMTRFTHTVSVPQATVSPSTQPINITPYKSNIPCRYDLMKILNETSGGQLVLNYYAKHHILREEHRTALINVIARYIDANGCTLTLSESNQMENQIVQMFPTEKAEFYRTSKRGRLYNKIANMKRIYKKFNKDSTDTPNGLASGPSSPASSSVSAIKEEEYVDEYNEYLVNDWRSKAQTTGNCMEFWKKSQAMRLKQIDEIESLQEILEKWPEYKEANITDYIAMDFAAKQPAATKFSDVFHDNIGKLEKLLFTKVSTCSAAFKHLQLYQKCSTESQHLIILWVLHQLFPPNHHTIVDEVGIKRKKRFSIQDSQNACICIRGSQALLEHFIRTRTTATPPLLLIVGELGGDIEEISVYFEGLRYPVESVVQAAELCCELYFLFNLDFPEEAILYYNFVQSFFLNIPPDVKNSKIYTTINDLNAY